LERRASFSFETVMSSPDEVALLEKARSLGYRSYLYFIATEDPQINIARVKSRVHLGGHDVPVDKIVSRYARSLDLLLPAIRQSNRAYLFDNSRHGGEHLWVA
jgi:predicted ABC-type ATPase